jgi:sortase (surface protein transpeptidase)
MTWADMLSTLARIRVTIFRMPTQVIRARRPLIVFGRAAVVLVLLVGIASGVACSKAPDVTLAATSTPTPTFTATPTPLPTPTPTPVSLAGAAFPPPPPEPTTPPANTSGIKRIIAPRLHLDHYVETTLVVGGEMQAPEDGNYAVGYYPDFTVKPGESGNAIFSAHETWQHMQGPFFALHFAQPGDDIYVQMTDGREFHYRISSYKRYALADMPMNDILNPPARAFGDAWITLITCGGRIVYGNDGFGEYLDRDVVVARLVR